MIGIRSSALPPPLWRTGPAYVFLALSDIHVKADAGFENRLHRLRRSFFEAWPALEAELGDERVGALLLLGDLTQASGRAEFETLDRCLIQHLLTSFDLKKEHLYAVPGNHDHLRNIICPSTAPASRTGFFAKCLTKLIGGVPGAWPKGAAPAHHPQTVRLLEHRSELYSDKLRWENAVGSRFFIFHEWARGSGGWNPSRSGGPWSGLAPRRNAHPDPAPFALRLVGLNTAIASNGFGEDDGAGLWLCDSQVDDALLPDRPAARDKDASEIVVALMHHAPEDLDDQDIDARRLLFSKVHVVLHGHHHKETHRAGTADRPPIVSLGALGHPRYGRKTPDVCAILRVQRERIQVFRLKQRLAELGQHTRFEWRKGIDGRLLPDEDLRFSDADLKGVR